MAVFHETIGSFEELLLLELRDLYDAERRWSDALPKVAGAVTDAQLKRILGQQHQETQQHIERLDRVFSALNHKAERHTCQAMKGLVKEAEELINADADADLRDAALIGAAQRVEHYQMAGYGMSRALAQRLGRDDVAAMLQQTLDEEHAADAQLTEVAETSVNLHAVMH